MRTLAMIAAAVLLAGPAFASPELAVAPARASESAVALPFAVGGRVARDAAPDDRPFQRRLIHQWPATYYETAFRGSQVDFAFDDAVSIFSVIVDGDVVGRLDRPGKTIYRVSGLADGDHLIRIERLTETQEATGAFEGFAAPSDTAPPLPARDRQIEFIGDSYTAGYGNTSLKRECTKEEVWATTDTQQAFGPQVARRFDADYQINAYSGIGVVRNYNGVAPRRNMPLLYRSALIEDETVHAYSDPEWDPAIVVIALGGNDFSTPVHAGETWATDADLRRDYIAGYAAFVQQVRASHPRAQFILMSYGEDKITTAIDEVIARLGVVGETRVRAFSTGSGFALTGCDWHLNLDDDRRIAASLGDFIVANPGLWE